jgi:hypothetical protein
MIEDLSSLSERESIMHCFHLLPLLSGLTLAAADPPVQKGLVVHEWGVFYIHDDPEIANADARGEWDELPKFMYGHISGRDLPVNWGVIEVRKQPVVFFHTPKPVALRMRIDFPGGMPGVWWPGTRSPAAQGTRRPAVGTSLEWQIQLREPPAGRRPPNENYHKVPKGHWVERMRAVEANDVFAVFGDDVHDVDREKFIYYDGIFPQGKWLKILVDKDRVSLRSQVKFPVHDVTVIDRRGDGKVKVARVEKLDAEAEIKEVKWEQIDRERFVAAAAETLITQLVAAGLFKDEAQALLATRRRDLLETDGLTVFYRLPQAEYERRLPMTLTPRAESLVRVGLVQHVHCEPEFAQRVQELATQLDDDSFKVREAAQKKLEAMGPSVRIHLARLRDKGALSAEARRRVQDLIDRWDARQAFSR